MLNPGGFSLHFIKLLLLLLRRLPERPGPPPQLHCPPHLSGPRGGQPWQQGLPGSQVAAQAGQAPLLLVHLPRGGAAWRLSHSRRPAQRRGGKCGRGLSSGQPPCLRHTWRWGHLSDRVWAHSSTKLPREPASPEGPRCPSPRRPVPRPPAPAEPWLSHTHPVVPAAPAGEPGPCPVCPPSSPADGDGAAWTPAGRGSGFSAQAAKDQWTAPTCLPLPPPLCAPGPRRSPPDPGAAGPPHRHLLRLKSQASHCNDNCSFIFRERTRLLLLL